MAQTKDLTKQDFEKALLLKVKENNVLKAQNARLIEHLQDQIDVTSTNIVQKESIHKKITQIGQLLSDLTREEEDRKINIDRVFQKISDLENRVIVNRKEDQSPTIEAIHELKLNQVKIETHLQHLGTQISNTNQAISILINKLLKIETKPEENTVPFTAEAETANTSTPLTDDEFKKIADEFKTELKGTDEDIQLIYRLLFPQAPNPPPNHPPHLRHR